MHEAVKAAIESIAPLLGPWYLRDRRGVEEIENQADRWAVGLQLALKEVQLRAGAHEQALEHGAVGVLGGGQAVGDVREPGAPEQVSLLAAAGLVGERVEIGRAH